MLYLIRGSLFWHIAFCIAGIAGLAHEFVPENIYIELALLASLILVSAFLTKFIISKFEHKLKNVSPKSKILISSIAIFSFLISLPALIHFIPNRAL